MNHVIDLSEIQTYEARNGDVLTGTAGKDIHLFIAPGATVTLNGVTLACMNAQNRWAAITCLGDARIVLEGVNIVRCGNEHFPGILPAEGKTLTLGGTGSLSIGCNGWGAGIGGGYQISCGNIVIEDGFIVAQGGKGAPAIGGGYTAECGNISIKGGTITAIGGYMACGIGCGLNGKCGDITIGKKLTYLAAKRGNCGDFPADDIGRSVGGTCGTVVNLLAEEHQAR